MGVLVNRTLWSGVRTALAMIAILSCSDLPTEPDALNTDDLSLDEARVVATVEVTLGSSTLKPGETTQATVILRDRYGNVLNRAVQWSSSDVAVATVSDSGLVTAVASGVTQIIATRRTHVGSATLTVTEDGTPPPATVPGTVSDLAVSAIANNSVTLSFTQVDDGTGKPANYDVRYAIAPISWGSAAATTSGTCTTPVVGTGIGSRLTCTVLGLSPSTNYNFQLVAFRGTLNVDAVFGGLSNIVSAATTALAPPPPPPGGSNEPTGMTVINERAFNAL
ncbi:MAG TPA: Ig-like domain-containing protein, partial [Gemmatimonadaceae bacterium]|nr:Ig-like domain-containing protein [Gemmatimonadaceae bacterium]